MSDLAKRFNAMTEKINSKYTVVGHCIDEMDKEDLLASLKWACGEIKELEERERCRRVGQFSWQRNEAKK